VKVPSQSDLPTSVALYRGPQPSLASRPGASWIEARVTKAAKVSARFSKSLARRRLRPNQGEGALDHP
jgi:hypothetical protein